MGLEENILNFKIAVDDILSMTVTYCTDDLFKIVFGLLLRDGLSLFEEFEKLSSLKIFHDNVDLHIFEHVTIDDFYDIWVIESFEVLYLTEYHIDVIGSAWFIKKKYIFFLLL